MKFNLAVFKKGKPIYWIIGGIVIFAVFYFMFSRGGSSGGSTQVVTTGPSEALQAQQLQAATQLQIAQAQANISAQDIAAQQALGLAGLQVQLAQIQAGADVTKLGYEHDAAIAFANIDASKAIAGMNMSYGLESTRIASEAALFSKQIDAETLRYQMDTNRSMFETQSRNLIAQSAIGAVSGPHVKEITRLPVLQLALTQG